MNIFLTSNDTRFRLLRTIASGILGVLIANVDYFVSFLHFSAETKTVIIALIMAVTSPIMSELGKSLERDEDDDIEVLEDEPETFDYDLTDVGDEEEGEDDEQ